MRSLWLLLAVGLGGCATVPPPAPDAAPATIDAARRIYDGRMADVVLADGSTWSAAALQIGPAETSWVDAGEVVRVPTCAVAEVRARPAAAWRLPVGRVLAVGGAGLAAGTVAGAVCFGDTACTVGLALGSVAVGVLMGVAAAHASRPPPPPRPVRLAPTCDLAPVRRALRDSF